jgi:hypothetical protein
VKDEEGDQPCDICGMVNPHYLYRLPAVIQDPKYPELTTRVTITHHAASVMLQVSRGCDR